jgi:hypothetical protein
MLYGLAFVACTILLPNLAMTILVISALVSERFLLPEDAERLIADAAKAKIFAEKTP